MRTEIKIPLFPETTRLSKVSEIYVNEGQKVEVGQTLFDVETDKVVLEVEAPFSGVIESFKITNGDHVVPEQIAMYIRESESNEVYTDSQNVKYIEVIKEKLVKDDSDRFLLQQVIGNSLFDKRGIICGVFGFFLGILIGSIFTYVLIGN